MTSTEDTICAVSTPAGVGGIAVIRVSGSDALEVCSKIWRGKPLSGVASHTAHLGTVTDLDGYALDQAVATVFRAPASFTGQDVVELSVHGSRYVQQQLIQALIGAGARLAEAGEFTRRAFIAGKLDLAQAEAVADIIASEGREAHTLAMTQMRGGFSCRLAQLRQELLEIASLLELELDFSEEDVEFASRIHLRQLAATVKDEVDRLSASFSAGQAIKNGIPVAIIGRPNVGKSSILNRLLGDDRAIVSNIPGTTRDTIEDTITISGYTFRLIDTAGLRSTPDTIEALGVERSLAAAARARIVVYVTTPDASLGQLMEELIPIKEKMQTEAKLLIVYNKIDTLSRENTVAYDGGATSAIAASISRQLSDNEHQLTADVCAMSALTGLGFQALPETLADIAGRSAAAHDLLITNARHYEALCASSESMARVINGLEASLSGDLIAIDLRQAISDLGSITGTITTPEILFTIFSRFCIGK